MEKHKAKHDSFEDMDDYIVDFDSGGWHNGW